MELKSWQHNGTTSRRNTHIEHHKTNIAHYSLSFHANGGGGGLQPIPVTGTGLSLTIGSDREVDEYLTEYFVILTENIVIERRIRKSVVRHFAPYNIPK